MNKSHILKFLSVLLDICQFYWPFRWASIFALLISLCWLSTFNLIDLCCSVFIFCLLISGFLDLDFKSLCLSAFMFLSVSVCLSVHPSLICTHSYYLFSLSVCACTQHSMCVKVRGQLAEGGSLLPSCDSQGSKLMVRIVGKRLNLLKVLLFSF